MKTYALNMPSRNVSTSILKEMMEEHMDFSLTREQEMIKKLAKQFAENELDPVATAPIFDCADYGITGDLFKIIPMMIDEIINAKSNK